jgi:hypothetical protein
LARLIPDQGLEVTSYAAATVAEQWRRDFPIASIEPDATNFHVTACAGHLICVWLNDAQNPGTGIGELIGLDPDTGRPLWRLPSSSSPPPFRFDRILITGRSGQPGASANAVVDASSGRVLHSLGAATVIAETDNRIILLDQKIGDPESTTVRQLLPDRTTPIDLGDVPAPPNRCTIGSRYLACITAARQVQVWRIRN